MDQTDTDQPIARFRWLRRLLLATVGVILSLAALRLVTSWKVARELADYRQKVIAVKGSWTAEERAVRPAVLDKQNAAFVFRAALAMFVPGQEGFRNSNEEWDTQAVRPANWYYRCEASDERYAAMFARAREAIDLSYSDWNRFGGAGGPWIGRLLNELLDNAEYRHFRGDDLTAITRIRTGMRLAHSFRQSRSEDFKHVSGDIDTNTLATLLRIAPELRVEDAAVRDAARRLIGELATHEQEAVRETRAGLLEELTIRCRDLEKVSGLLWISQPLPDRRVASYARAYLDVHDNLDGPYRPRPGQSAWRENRSPPALSVMAGVHEIGLAPSWDPRVLLVEPMPYPGPVGESLRRTRLTIRFAQVSLAVRLFRHAHGRFPQRVQELVPDFLPELPLHPGFEPNPIEIMVMKGAHRDGSDRIMLVADGQSNTNEMPRWYCDSWNGFRTRQTRGHEAVRQWCDVAPWPESALVPAAESQNEGE